MTMRRRTRVLLIVGLACVGLTQLGLVRRFLFPGPGVRRIQRLFRFSEREFGDLLEGVKLRFADDLELAVVVDREGRCRGQKVLEGHGSAQRILEDVSRTTGVPERDLTVEQYALGGVYTPSDRLIRISLLAGPKLDAAGEEIAHAALNVPYRRVEAAQAVTARSLDEALAGALGRIELVAEFTAKEERVPAEEISRKRAEMAADFWRRSEAEPEHGLFSGSTVATEPYHHSIVVRATVDEIVSQSIPLREKFLLGRKAILLHTMTAE